MRSRLLVSLALLAPCCATRPLPPGLRELPAVVSVPLVTCPATLDRGVRGVVVLAVRVGSRGEVESVQIDHDIGGGCGEVAATALREAVFRPAIAVDGRAVAHTIRYEYEFAVA